MSVMQRSYTKCYIMVKIVLQRGIGGEISQPSNKDENKQRVLSYKQKDRTLVQSNRMLYNGSYFDQKGCIDELNQDAPGARARASPKRKKPVVSTPLVAPGKYSLALVGPLLKGHHTERYTCINRSDDSICRRKSPEILVLFPRKIAEMLKIMSRTYALWCLFWPGSTIRNPFFSPCFTYE